MFTFILYFILALTFGYFATQNTQSISIVLFNQSLPDIPLFIVLGATLLTGIIFSWIVSLFNSLASALTLRGKERTIKEANSAINDLTKQVNQLESENDKLKKQIQKEHENPSN
ncbi:MAG: lipopolysaccharide assembly protein LapA domain-containing protein [Desulfobacteraceae bacterium]